MTSRDRLDRVLARRYPSYSRTQIKRLIQEGFVRVGGRVRKASTLVGGNEPIELVRRAPEIPEARPEPIPLNVIHEDPSLLVLNKPAGLVIHPAPGNPTGTLLNALLYHVPWIGLVHRLDKGTSGVLVVAKTEGAQRDLSLQFKRRLVEKVYQVLVWGAFGAKEGTIERSVGRDPFHRRKFSSRSRKPREALTNFRVVREYGPLSLLEVRPKTGRTHQIRVHLSEERHPVAGDTLYGAGSFLSSVKDESVRDALASLARPMLHASEISFRHPVTGEIVRFLAPTPEDFRRVTGLLEAG